MNNFVKPFPNPIHVTRPILPDISKVNKIIETIWESKQLTNSGIMAQTLEKELSHFLKVDNLSLFCNGTTALQLACKALRLTGEVITTPFTFAATPHAISWCGLEPVFCDIEGDTFNLDPEKIEELITPRTSAILPVHVFGIPCRLGRIQEIADKYALKVVYDAAHAFGVEIGGKSIGSFGNISMFSFHATKVFHTIEGGALAFESSSLKQRSDLLRNFGIVNEDCIIEAGTNGKLNELQSAVGLLVLELICGEIAERKRLTFLYRELLKDIPGIGFCNDMENVTHNYNYFVITVDKAEFGHSRDELLQTLRKYNVYARKYFYPLNSHLPCYRNRPSANSTNLPVAEKAADMTLALPLYGELAEYEVETICTVIKHTH